MRLITLFIIILIPLYTVAQMDRELFHIKYNASPLTNNGDRDRLNALDINLKFPLSLTNSYKLAGGLSYESLWTGSSPVLGGHSLHGLSTQLLFGKKLENDHALLAFATIGAYSDFKDISSEDFRFAAGIRFKSKLHERVSIWYGAAISKQFFGTLIAPFVDLEWQINNRLDLSGPVPINPKLKYRLSPRTKLSFFIKPENATYRLSEKEDDSRYFQKKQWNAGLGLDYRLTSHWLMTLQCGRSLKRSFEIYDSSQTGVLSIFTYDVRGRSKRTPYYSYQENAFFAELTLAWVLDIKED